jgi:hypothetical protein
LESPKKHYNSTWSPGSKSRGKMAKSDKHYRKDFGVKKKEATAPAGKELPDDAAIADFNRKMLA